MSELQLGLAHATKLAMVVLLAGMILRDRARQCWMLTLLVSSTLVGNTLSSLWPVRFFTPEFWTLKQGLYDALQVGVALEVAFRAFRMFPGAWRVARVVIVSLLLASTVVLWALVPRMAYGMLWTWEPSTLTAATWLLTGTALVVVWYQIPIRRWQRAIILGLALYQSVFAGVLHLLERHGWTFGVVGDLDSFAYLLLLAFWNYVAWRRDAAAAAVAPHKPVLSPHA